MICWKKHFIFSECFFFIGVKINGKIIKIESKDYYVLSEYNKIFRCSLRGKFKKDLIFKKDKLSTYDLAVLGDFVNFTDNSDSTGVIEEIKERKNYLSRKAKKLVGSLKRGERLEQIIASNLDNIAIVTSIKHPKFNNRFLDRALVTAHSCGINVLIIINKIDLDHSNLADGWDSFYKKIGYNVFLASATKNIGIEKIKSAIDKKSTLFWGQSGVGKSTLLNVMFPHLNFEIGEISNYSNKGKHTTVTGVLEKVADKTYIIDTPGIREIDPYGIKKEDLAQYFSEFKAIMHKCKFNTCIHKHEPDCAVINAFKTGQISRERYLSYLNMLSTIEDDMFF